MKGLWTVCLTKKVAVCFNSCICMGTCMNTSRGTVPRSQIYIHWWAWVGRDMFVMVMPRVCLLCSSLCMQSINQLHWNITLDKTLQTANKYLHVRASHLHVYLCAQIDRAFLSSKIGQNLLFMLLDCEVHQRHMHPMIFIFSAITAFFFHVAGPGPFCLPFARSFFYALGSFLRLVFGMKKGESSSLWSLG